MYFHPVCLGDMKKFAVSASLLLLTVFAAAQTDGVRFTETAAYTMLTGLLKERNVNFSQRELMTDYGAFGVSIEARFPMNPDASGGTGLFVLAVPVSCIAADGAETPLNWGHELALSLIDRLSSAADGFSFETLVCFIGDSQPPYTGLNALFDELEGRDDSIIVYCEFPEAPAVLALVRDWGKPSAPLELAEPLFQICAENETPCFFGAGDSGVQNLINERGSDIPALYISGNAPAWAIAAKTDKKLTAGGAAALLCRYAETVMRNGVQETDKNYVYLGFSRRGLFISGFTLVLAALFGFSFIVFLYFFLYIVTKSRRKHIFISVSAALAIVAALLLFVTYINGAHFLSSSAEIPSAPTTTLYSASAEARLTARAESRILLERRIVSIDIEAALEPLRYRLFFTTASENGSAESPFYFIYDAPMPYTVEDGRIEFMLGSYPPDPLKLEIALPLGLAGKFSIEAFFHDGLNITQIFAEVP
jgi:hypothetical protein